MISAAALFLILGVYEHYLCLKTAAAVQNRLHSSGTAEINTLQGRLPCTFVAFGLTYFLCMTVYILIYMFIWISQAVYY